MTTRREFALGAAALLAAGAATAAARPRLGERDLADPLALHRVYRRVRFAADDRIVFWWMKGRRYGLVDNVLTPFFDMHVGSMHRCTDTPDGWRVATATAMYFTLPGSDALLEQWDNPVTGQRVEFRYPAPAPVVTAYTHAAGLQPSEASPMPGMRAEVRHFLDPLERVGPDVWIREESHLVLVPERTDPALRPMRVHDTYTFQAPVAALLGGDGFVPAACQFNDFNDWSPRFQMGDRPGTSVSRCAGRKVARLQDLPAPWLAIARRVHPGALRDPARTLGG